jgi:hypothetical protein
VTRRDRLRAVAQWLGLGALVGALCGAAAALFLWLLDEATAYRTDHAAIVFALPVAGLAIGWIYERLGAPIAAGNNLVIDTIHDDGPELPLRMAPMVLIGTVLTHLFGGSAGREGTAVQMGASLTDWVSHRLRLTPALRTPAARGRRGRRLRRGVRHADRRRGVRPRVRRARPPRVRRAGAGAHRRAGRRPHDPRPGRHAHDLPGGAGGAADAAARGQVAGVRDRRGRGDDAVHRADPRDQAPRRAAGAAAAAADGARRPRRRRAVAAARHEPTTSASACR